MTRDEFEAGYAARSGISLETLHALGMHGERCGCGEDGCPGWQMLSQLPARVRAVLERWGGESEEGES